MSLLELRKVRKTYGSTVAVDAVDLKIEQGEFVSLLGPSGSGKTTTLMMIAGLIGLTSGEMLLKGAPIAALPPYRRNIGMVFQEYALFPHMTVAENIGFPLKMRGVDKATIARRVDEVLKVVGLPSVHQRLPAALSGGQQQRVALARAIVFEPALLLMDEPLGALDKRLREAMQIEISRLHRQLGITIIYVTHDQEEAMVMSDKIAVFNHGKIEQFASPAEIYEQPQTGFVAGFVGDSSFLPGRVERTEGQFAFLKTAHGSFCGINTGNISAGDAALIAVRPERLVVTGAGEARNENCVDGVVSGVIYTGSARKITIKLNDGSEMVSLIHANSFENQEHKEGSNVRALWQRDRCSIVSATGDTAKAHGP